MRNDGNYYYGLDEDKNVIPVSMEDASWDFPDRIVGKTNIGPYLVSTVFMPINHNWRDEGLPIVFETMVFNEDDGASNFEYLTRRYCMWDEALEGHKKAVREVEEIYKEENEEE